MTQNADIIEIFSSIQGEGPYIGYRQIFVRFAGCNLSCEYCDTPFEKQEFCNIETVSGSNEFKKIKNPVSVDELLKGISVFSKPHSISLTGGEPLLQTEFLQDFLPKFKAEFPHIKVYLETNGTLFEELKKIISHIDIISMDLKLKSSTGKEFPLEKHRNFIETALFFKKEIFAKAVITNKISNKEIEEVSELLNSFEKTPTLILQPVTSENSELLLSSKKILKIQESFLEKLPDVRVIPQTHKFLDLL